MKKDDSLKKFKYKVAAFYNFISIIDEEILLIKEELTNLATNQKIKGTILLASEGVNGTICGTENAIVQFIETLEKLLKVSDINVKYSWSEKQAFRRFKARKKKEIVTIGLKEINPTKSVGKYIKAAEWNKFLENPENSKRFVEKVKVDIVGKKYLLLENDYPYNVEEGIEHRVCWFTDCDPKEIISELKEKMDVVSCWRNTPANCSILAIKHLHVFVRIN